MSRLYRPPPTNQRPRDTLDQVLHLPVDSALKELKKCRNQFKVILATFQDEHHILERLYYKGKNQHNSALFWKRVAETRRYCSRLYELDLGKLIDDVQLSFFDANTANKKKALKGAWTYYPDPKFVAYMRNRLELVYNLASKTHARLTQAYRSLSLAMQSGAFIQYIVLLVAIVSRMDILTVELLAGVQQASFTLRQLYDILEKLAPLPSPEIVPQGLDIINSAPLDPSALDCLVLGMITPETNAFRTPNSLPSVTHKFSLHRDQGIPTQAGEVVDIIKRKRTRTKTKKKDEIDDIFSF
ncbi:uncharacterized protein BT62DRAFT_1070308 [Guyanagaster necrorhizus]|uniref:Nucleolus and neural progenitor protein-like N-terminal domain-containing protein n=1 Tax=Guyanagaster necrorhizus TaxID=856835 RepID=A0A9P8AYT4_9AGAR|nr:uncharacterized protein BT62DRAFT_1070308 [Guyanagaster necrorhizus MCA 3950]KAG7452556.1 hypothetical protein BT62DRAFT_1070308 [Guyanagaster necrorhizus MCA 3950]